MPKFKVLPNGLNTKKQTYENLTINAMLNLANNNDGYYLYIHSKGTTNVSSTQIYWRRFMMKWMVSHYDVCIDILNRGYYTIGTNIQPNYKPPHYSGNFF